MSHRLFNASQNCQERKLLLELSISCLEVYLSNFKSSTEITNSRIIPKLCLLRGYYRQSGNDKEAIQLTQRLVYWSKDKKFIKEYVKMAANAVVFGILDNE